MPRIRAGRSISFCTSELPRLFGTVVTTSSTRGMLSLRVLEYLSRSVTAGGVK